MGEDKKEKIDYNTLTEFELKMELLGRGLDIEGIKPLLVGRLEEDDRRKKKQKKMPEAKLNPVIAPYDGPKFTCVVIDGSNVIHSGSGDSNKMSLQRILSTQLAVEKLGWPTLLAMKQGTFDAAQNDGRNPKRPASLTTKERNELNQMNEMGLLTLIHTPKKYGPDGKDAGIDDEFLIKTAITKNGWILSNDKYRDHIRELKKAGHNELADEIQKRWIQLTFVGNDSTPIFELPRNGASKIDTEVEESVKQLEEILAEYDNVEVKIRIDGKIVNESVSLPLREPLGRQGFFWNILAEDDRSKIKDMSRAHFKLHSLKRELWIMDLDSKNGTLMDGVKIPPKFATPMNKDNAVIRIGRLELLFGVGGHKAEEE